MPTGARAFTLPRAGAWLIKAVHMIRAPSDAGADWESFWASLTFALPPGRARRRLVNSVVQLRERCRVGEGVERAGRCEAARRTDERAPRHA